LLRLPIAQSQTNVLSTSVREVQICVAALVMAQLSGTNEKRGEVLSRRFQPGGELRSAGNRPIEALL
jgi:hypothetical protein